MTFYAFYCIIVLIKEVIVLIDEKAVLEKLNISDFRHLTKNNVIDLATELHNVEPEVAMKILEQFPEFSKVLSEVLQEYRQQLDAILQSENTSEKDFINVSNREIDILEGLLTKHLSFDEKIEILDRIDKVRQDIMDHQSEKRHFLMGLVKAGVTAIGIIVAGALGALGVNVHKNTPSQLHK